MVTSLFKDIPQAQPDWPQWAALQQLHLLLPDLMALVVQKTGAAQGNANPIFYSMGQNQFGGGIAVYHDTTSGNNTVPGIAGFSAGVGYDLVTGWGSVDASKHGELLEQ